jgi:hypothetical protein
MKRIRWTRNFVKNSTACPVCFAKPGEQCVGVNKFKQSLHTERWSKHYEKYGDFMPESEVR